MALSFVVLLGLVVIGAVVLGGLLLSVLLIVNEKTRLLGVVLLAVLLLGVPVVGAGVAFLFVPVAVKTTPTAAPAPAVRYERPVRVEPLPPQPEMAEDTPTDEPKAAGTGGEELTDSETAKPGDEAGDEAGALWVPGGRSVRWQSV